MENRNIVQTVFEARESSPGSVTQTAPVQLLSIVFGDRSSTRAGRRANLANETQDNVNGTCKYVIFFLVPFFQILPAMIFWFKWHFAQLV